MILAHEQKVAATFSKSAETYDHHANIQVLSGSQLISKIKSLNDFYPRVLDAGCGTGKTTARLADNIRHDYLHAIDHSEALLAKARLLTSAIHWELGDFNEIHASQKYDLVFSNLALHWSHSFPHTLRVLHLNMQPDGLLAFTLPLSGTFREITSNCAVQSFFNFTEVKNILRLCDFELIQADSLSFSDAHHDSLQALRSIKLCGTNFVADRKHKALRGKSFLKQLNCRELSYEIGCFLAGKK